MTTITLSELNDRVDTEDLRPDDTIDGSTVAEQYLEATVENASMDEIDDVYSEWSDSVNMTASELERWSGNPCSREASVDPGAVIKRNLRLLTKNKDDWTTNDIEDAKRTISFISRMSDSSNEPEDPRDGPHGCPSEWAISLLNWAYNPFDSLPEQPESDEIEDVDEITMTDSLVCDDCKHELADTMLQQANDADDVRALKKHISLAESRVHMPNFTSKTTGEWDSPNLGDMTDEQFNDLSPMDRMEIANHFIGSKTGFPPDNYTDLFLPVVTPDGELSLQALQNAKSRISRVDGITDEQVREAGRIINRLANTNFQDADFTPMEEMTMSKHNKDEMADTNYEFTPVPTQVLYADRDNAMERADDLGLDGVHAHKIDGTDMYMPGSTHDDWRRAVTSSVENDESDDADDVEQLQDWSMHEPSFESTDDREWNRPNLEDFTDKSWSDMSEDERSDVSDHFVLADGGFPPETYGDLALPVVEPDGTLNLNALANAKARASQVEGLSDDMVDDVKMLLTELANENFEDADFDPVEEEEMQEEVDYAFDEGDNVMWQSSGGRAEGVVRDRTKEDCYDASIDGDVTVCGEPDNPAYLIEVFDDDGEPSETMVAHKQETLEPMEMAEAETVAEEGVVEHTSQEDDSKQAYVLTPNTVQQVDGKK